MKFHKNKNFIEKQYHNGTLWYAGNLSEDDLSYIHLKLCRKEIPNSKWSMSIVWQSKEDGYFFAQVDHLSTYPLWYNDDTKEIWAQWSDVEKRDFPTNDLFYAQRELFLDTMTIGELSPRQGVDRIMPDHCIKNGTLKRYKHSFDLSKKAPPINTWEEILHNAIKTNCKDGDMLFLSGGRDSTTIANFAIFNEIDLDYVHISDSDDKLDTQSTKQFESNNGIKVNYLHPDDIKEFLPEYHDNHWHDGSFRFKYNAMKTLGKTRGLTGEFGASEHGHSKINYIHQCTDLTTDKLVNLHITTLEARNDASATPIWTDKGFLKHEIGKLRKDAYEYILDYVEDLITYNWQKANTKEQQLEVLLNILKQEHESYRLFGYSQDPDHTWNHPLADWTWADIIMNTCPIVRKIGKHDRWVYKMATKNCEWFDDTAWQFGRPRGMSK